MLSVTREAGVSTLTLSRPGRGNALAPDLVEALIAAVQAVAADASLHTLVLRGEGRHFCTGLDLSDLESSSDADWLWRLVRIETLLDRAVAKPADHRGAWLRAAPGAQGPTCLRLVRHRVAAARCPRSAFLVRSSASCWAQAPAG